VSSESKAIDERELDFVITALLTGLALGEEAQRRLHARGHPILRFSHGYVFQHLMGEPITIGELAHRLGVTQQAASKVTGELEAAGYLERRTDQSDRRARRIALTDAGRDAIAQARAGRAELAAELADRLGADRLEEARAILLEALDAIGGLEAIRGRRVPPVR
jgi:DNA-binding MarR family transcriptional regulator